MSERPPKPPAEEAPAKPKSRREGARKERGRGGKPETPEVPDRSAVSFEAQAAIPVEPNDTEFTGAVMRDFPLDEVRMSANGEMPPDNQSTYTVGEARGKLQGLVQQYDMQGAHEVLDKESRLEELEEKLREQTQKFYSKKNRLLRLGYADLKKAEQAYDKALYESAKQRQSSEKLNGLEIVQEVVKKGAAVKEMLYKEALSVDDRYGFEKALALIPKGNKWLEKKCGGPEKAMVFKAAATALLLTTAGAAVGAFGAAGIGAVMGIGAFRFGRSLVAAAVGTYGGMKAGNWFDRVIGKKTQEKARTKLETLSLEGDFDEATFKRIQKDVRGLIHQADDATRERNKALVQIFTAVGLGAGASSIASLLPDVKLPFFSGSPPVEAPVAQPAAPVVAEAPTAVEAPVPVEAPTERSPWPMAKAEIPVSAPQESAVSTPTPEVEPSVETPAPAAPEAPASVASPVEPPTPSEAPALSTADLNRAEAALGGRVVAPMSAEALASATPYEAPSAPELSVESTGADVPVSSPETSTPESPVVETENELTVSEETKPVETHVDRTEGETARPEVAVTHEAVTSEPPAPVAEAAPAPAPRAEAPAPVPTETAGVPASTEAPTGSEVPATPEPAPFESSIRPVQEIAGSAAWETYRGHNALSLFVTAPPDGTPEATMRSNIFDTMRQSGIGPAENESLETYLKRASTAVEVARMTGEPIVQPGVFATENGKLLVQGGDASSRLRLAEEYVRLNPAVKVIVEAPGGTAPYIEYPSAPSGLVIDGRPVFGYSALDARGLELGNITRRVF